MGCNSNGRGGTIVIQEPQTFEKPNDISNKGFNPVIHKIQNFMAKKERRISDKANTSGVQESQQKVSFLSIRNIWVNPSAASTILERSRSEN